MVPGALKQSGKEDDNFFSSIINSGAVLDESKRVSHMQFCTHDGLFQRVRGVLARQIIVKGTFS